jgi:lysophospholipase
MLPMTSSAFDRRAWPVGGALDIWHTPDGWPLRRFRMGDGGRGHMLVVGGRGDMIEKYLEPLAHWAERGWRVTTFDWRGQGGSGRITADPALGHMTDFGVLVDDLAAIYRASGGDRGPNVVMAHSMGGHLALRAMVEGVITPDAAVLTAPMLGLRSAPLPESVAPWIARAIGAAGLSGRPAWKDNPYSPFRAARLTHSAERFADDLWWRENTPEIALGAPSWGWIGEAYRSTRALERSPAVERMRVPTLILAASTDRLVSPAAINRMAARLPDVRLHTYGPEAAHEILREADGVRIDAFERIDAFLDERVPSA